MRLRLEDETRFNTPIRINGIWDEANEKYDYELAQELPRGLGPEAFIGAIVEVHIPQYSTWKDPDELCGGRIVYGHITAATYDYYTKTDGTIENPEDIVISCAFTFDIDEGDFAEHNANGYMTYYPNSSWQPTFRLEVTSENFNYIQLTKTIDEATGDVTYDGSITGDSAAKLTNYRGPFANPIQIYKFNIVNSDNPSKTLPGYWATKVAMVHNAANGKPYEIHFERYLDYLESEIVLNKSEATSTKVSPGVYTHAYHLNFTVPAANVKPGM